MKNQLPPMAEPASWPWLHVVAISDLPTTETVGEAEIEAEPVLSVRAGVRVVPGKPEQRQKAIFVVMGFLQDGVPSHTVPASHAEIIRALPGLAPIVALHMADSNGAPFDPHAGALYWMSGVWGDMGSRPFVDDATPATPDACLAGLSGVVRIPIEEARALADSLKSAHPTDLAGRERALNAWVDAQFPRWASEAKTAVAWIDHLAQNPSLAFAPYNPEAPSRARPLR